MILVRPVRRGRGYGALVASVEVAPFETQVARWGGIGREPAEILGIVRRPGTG